MINFKEKEQTLKDLSIVITDLDFSVSSRLPPGNAAVKRDSYDEAVEYLADRIVELIGIRPRSCEYDLNEEQADTKDRIFDDAVARIQSERSDPAAQEERLQRQCDEIETRSELGDMDEHDREVHAEELADIRNRKILAACEEHDREVLEYMREM